MSRKIASTWAIFVILMILIQPGFAARAQGLSFPAEINKRFDPILIPSGGVSRLIVTIYNPNSFTLNNATWMDNLVGVQPGLSIANPANLSNTCGGNVTAVSGTTTLSLSGGTVPAQSGINPGDCTVEIDVTSTTVGNLINTIPAEELSSTGGGVSITNTTPASATLTVIPVPPPTVNKSFSPSTIWAGEVSVLTITINNNNPVDSLTGTSLTDSLPANVVVANPPLPANALQNCGPSATLTANPGGTSVTLNNATVAPSPNCVIRVNVTSTTPGEYVNTIPANALINQQGVTNASPDSASLDIEGVGVDKSFLPSSFQAGGNTTLTITLYNPTSSPYTGVSIEDPLPGTVLTVVPGSATTTCGGTATAELPRTLTSSGGTIPPGTPNNPGTCTITVQVTAPADTTTDTFTNTIPANSVTTNQGVTNIIPASANVQVYTAGGGITANKAFSPSTIDAGENSRLRFNFNAPEDVTLTNFSFTDNLPAGVTISNSQGPTITGCGPGATLTAETGTNVIALTGATINAGALCRVQVWVTSTTPGTVINSMPPENINNDQNRTLDAPLTDNLTVLPLSDLAVAKEFTPTTVAPNGVSTLTIALRNTNTSSLVNVTVTDNLPGTNASNTVSIASVPNASTTCGAGVITASPGSQTITMTGGTVPAQVGDVPGICTISVDVQGSNGTGDRTNTIPPENVTGTIEGTTTTISPILGASSTLRVRDLSIGVVKGFNPLTVFGGSASTMTVQLINPNTTQLTGITFTDNMPSGMFLASPTNFSVGTCGGTLSGNPGENSFTFSGGSLPASSSCSITLSVTMDVNGNLTNVIPIGSVTALNGVSNPEAAEATLTNLAGASVSKFFEPNPIAAGDFSLLTITIQNTSNVPLSGMGLIDTLPGTLPAGVAVAGASAPALGNNCGGTLSAVSGSQTIQLTNGSLAANSACTMVVAVTGTVPGEYENIIPAGALTTAQNATNSQPAIDTLIINGTTGTAALGDFVWLDADQDGIQDAGENGIPGVTVRLLDQNGTEIATTTTNASGFYNFTNLAPGTYRVDFVPPAGYSVSPENQGANDAVDSDANPTTGETANVTLAAGETNNTLDAGLYQSTALAALGDYVWLDADADGIQDAGENGVPNVTVRLLDENGNELATTTTDATGLYSFTNLTPGTYRVDFIPPAGYSVSPANQGANDAVDSDASLITGETANVTLAAGETNNTLDAGLYQPAALGDFVWLDADQDGIQDAGENGIPGVTVRLLDANGNELATTTTDATGLYSFTDLAPGTYRVDFVPPTGYTVSPANQGANDAADSDASLTTGETANVTLAPGETNNTLDAGLYQPAALGDFVWLDADQDGVQDAGENGIPGVTVRLLDQNGAEIATTTTDASGFYSFTDLVPGTYRVDFVPPAGYSVSPANQGGDDAVDSDANVTTGETANVVLAAGQTNNTLDAGLYATSALAALGDYVWLDADADGIQDAGENGVPNVTVRLLDENGAELATTTTDSSGLYSFTNLTPGTYRVDFIPPSGYSVSPANQGANDAVDSDANLTTGETANVTLAAGETNNTLDAGLYQPAALGDFVWLDADQDGIQDAGEIGVANVTVRLLDANGAELATTTTDTNGLYSFTNLVPGTYRVDFVPPAGYTVSPANQGANDAADSDANLTTGETANVTLASGETNNTLDAGLFLSSPGIQVTKTITAVTFVNPNVVQMTYSIQVLNTGNVTLSNIQVTDDLDATFPPPATFSIVSLLSGTFSVNAGFNGSSDVNLLSGTNTLTPGANGVITLIVRVNTGGVDDTYINTAVARGTPPTGQEVQDSDSVPGPSFIDPALTKAVDPALASVGDLITFTITVFNNGNQPANGVVVTDPLPGNLEYVSATSVDAATLAPRGTITLIPPRTVQVSLGTLDVTDVVTITILAQVNSQGQPPVQNVASLVASAPPAGVSPDPIPNNSSTVVLQVAGSGGGGGSGGGDDGGGDNAGVTLGAQIPVTGFAPGRVTDLSDLPVTQYKAIDNAMLEIPVLKVKLPIVGVPKKGNSWDVNWLLNQAGWLQGSAFPGFSGNSALTSHVTLSNGEAGPFADLHKLKAGDKIFVRAFGELYIYEVKSIQALNPADPSILKHEDKSWLTLVTCADYNEKGETYLRRVVVKAVLVQSQPDRWRISAP